MLLKSYISSLFRREDGATMVEYGLMVALIAIVALVTVQILGVNLAALFQQIADAL